MTLTLSLDQAFSKANKFIKKGEIESALDIYKSVLQKFPKNFRALKAIKSLIPQSSVGDQNQLVDYYSSGQFHEGISLSQKLIQKHPYDHFLYNFLGIFYNALGNLQEAEKAYIQSLKINQSVSDIWNNFSVNQFDLEKFEESVRSCENALKLEPKNAKALNNLGNALLSLKKYNEALGALKKSYDIDPHSFRTLNNLGNTCQKLSLYDQAISYLQKGIELNNQDDELYYNIAMAYRDTGQFNKSYESFVNSLKIKQDNHSSFQNLVSLSLQLGHFELFQNKLYGELAKINSSFISQILFRIYLLINSFIKEDFIQSSNQIIILKSMIASNEFSQIKDEKDKTFIFGYYSFIEKLLSYYLQNKNNVNFKNTSENIIFHIGESHCLTFANMTINKKAKVKPLIAFGTKAWHLAQKKETSQKAIFANHLKSLPENSNVLISVGEIDCRENEGLITAYKKTGKNIDELINFTVDNYIAFVEKYLQGKNINRYYITVPAPSIEDCKNKDLHKLRIDIVKKFNQRLKSKTKEYNAKYIDTYRLTSDNEGASNQKFMADKFHLSPSILQHIENQISL